MMNRSIYIIGYGYIGQRIAQKLLEKEDVVHAFSRSDSRRIDHPNFHHHILDLDQTHSNPLNIPDNANVFYLAPPPGQGTEDMRLKNFLQLLKEQNISPARIVYFSATGIYGDCEGDWIDEDTPLNPQAERSKRRLDAENQLEKWCKQTPTNFVVLRVAGIYGPERLPIERLRKGMKVLDESIAPSSNRIHADDLADLAITAMEHSPDNEIYNAADGNPSSMTDYFSQVAKLAGLPQPERISMAEAQTELSPQMMSYLSESKKISNKKALKLLGRPLHYPTLEKGLINCL